jgi:hypothetical protein
MTELEAILLVTGALDVSEAQLFAQADAREDNLSDEDEEEIDNDKSSRMRSAATSVNARAPRNIRGPARKSGDSDSDFEFDL